MVETEFRAKHDRVADIFSCVESIFCIFPRDAGALPLLVVQKVRSESKHELRVDVAVYIVDDGIFRRGATKLTCATKGTICAGFRRDWIRDITSNVGHVALIHVPGLSRGVPFAVELVVPGEVIVLQVVVGILAVVDTVGAAVEVVVIAFCGVVQAADERGLRVRGPQRHVVTA